jgi:hypothetical protein
MSAISVVGSLDVLCTFAPNVCVCIYVEDKWRTADRCLNGRTTRQYCTAGATFDSRCCPARLQVSRGLRALASSGVNRLRQYIKHLLPWLQMTSCSELLHPASCMACRKGHACEELWTNHLNRYYQVTCKHYYCSSRGPHWQDDVTMLPN